MAGLLVAVQMVMRGGRQFGNVGMNLLHFNFERLICEAPRSISARAVHFGRLDGAEQPIFGTSTPQLSPNPGFAGCRRINLLIFAPRRNRVRMTSLYRQDKGKKAQVQRCFNGQKHSTQSQRHLMAYLLGFEFLLFSWCKGTHTD